MSQSLKRLFRWVYLTYLILSALILSLLGAYLLYLGGSIYYLITGLALVFIVRSLIKRDKTVFKVYGALLILSLLWALYESDSQFLSLLPRIAMWMVLSVVLFLPIWKSKSNDSDRFPGIQQHKHWLLAPLVLSVVALVVVASLGYERGQDFSRSIINNNSDTQLNWPQYGSTSKGTRFSNAQQITTENVADLKEAWRFRTGVADDFKMTPLQIDGTLYICGAKNIMIAIEDNTGKELWRHDPQVIAPAEHQYAKTCRGLTYVEVDSLDTLGLCKTRIVTGTVDARLIAVDAETGQICQDFGDGGSVNLRKGMGDHAIDEYYLTSPPLLAHDKLIVGGLVLDSQDLGLPSGVVRAFDAKTGEFVWAWDLGNPDSNGEPEPGLEYTRGTPNVWTIMSYDAELDLIYAPTGNASPDYYGGARRDFDDQWSSAIVALSGDSGKPVWKFQTVLHDIWDYDLPAQPVLVDVTRDGVDVPAVAVPTKRGDVFLLNRKTGEPVSPVEYKAVPQNPEKGEYLSKTQPFSSLPDFHPYRYEKDMWGLTPLDQLLCRVEYKMMRYEGLFTPPTVDGSFQYPANFGGFNWGSVSVDADNGLLIAAPMMLGNRVRLFTPEQVAEAGPRAALLLGKNHPVVRMDPESPIPEPREPDPNDPFDHTQIKYYGLTLPFMSRFYFPILGFTQVPCFEPPWSQLAVIDLNTDQLVWRRAVGSMKDSGPFGWRTGLPFQVGTPIRAGTMTTRGGLTFISSTMDSTVRAFDVETGELKWAEDLPGSGQATPMTYVSTNDGKQYLIVTVPNPSWIYPRDPKTGTYTDSRSTKDGKGGFVIAYALEDAIE